MSHAPTMVDALHYAEQEKGRQAFELYYVEALGFLREQRISYQVVGRAGAGGAVLLSRWGYQLGLPLQTNGQVQNSAAALITVPRGEWLNSNSLVVLVGTHFAQWKRRRRTRLQLLAVAGGLLALGYFLFLFKH